MAYQNRHTGIPQRIVAYIAVFAVLLLSTLSTYARDVKILDAQSGLPGDNVQEIFTDSKGLMWIGTNEGLHCYNGSDIISFEPKERGAQRAVAHVIELHDGSIMLGTRGGLCRVNIEEQRYDVIHDNVNIVNALCIVSDTLIVGSRNGLWIYHNDNHIEQILLDETVVSRGNAINAMVTDGEEGVWIATNERLIHMELRTREITPYDIPPHLLNGNIRTLCRIDSTLYIGPHTGKLFCFDNNAQRFRPFVIDLENILSLNTDGKILFVGTNGNGAYSIDPNTPKEMKHWHTQADSYTIPGNTVNHFSQSHHLNMNCWGIYPNGMAHETPNSLIFLPYRYKDFNSAQHCVRSFCIHGHERIIATTEGLWYIDEQRDIIRTYSREQFGNNHINDIAYHAGKYLIAAKGIIIYDPHDHTLTPLQGCKEIEQGIFNNLCTIANDSKILSCSNLGIVIIDSALQVEQRLTPYNSKLPESYPVDIFSDGKGKTWIGTTSQLCILDERTGLIQSENFPNPFFDKELSLHFTKATDGDIIAYTERDIYKCKSDLSQFAHYDIAEYLGNTAVMMIEPYREGYWIGTNTGLILCDEQFKPIKRFDKGDGLCHAKVSGRKYIAAPDSTLWIALEQGIALLPASHHTRLHEQKESKVIINKINVNNKDLTGNEIIQLERNKEPILIKWNFGTAKTQIYPILTDYANQRGRIYEWRIGDKPYQMTLGTPDFHLESLPLGRHTLRIRLLGHEETASDYFFHVIPTHTFWLELSLTIAIICIGVMLHKYRNRKQQMNSLLRQKHQLELQIAADQAIEAHKQQELKRISEKEEERLQAIHQRTQRSSELHRTLAEQVRTYLEVSKEYRNPSLKVADIATAVGTTTTNISEMCSMYLETSFFAFINSYRIAEFKRCVRDQQYDNYTITALAEMCGFKKSSFFNVFKEHEGCTPSVWLKQEGIKRQG